MKISDFSDTGPMLQPEMFFLGDFEGWGVMQALTGKLEGRYTIRASGVWSAPENVLKFSEIWTFDNGHVDELNWLIRTEGETGYTGAEPRLDGEAKGDRAGCAFHWRYTRDTPQPGGGSTKLHFDDWFWRVDEHVMIAFGVASKLAVPFASAHVTYRKLT